MANPKKHRVYKGFNFRVLEVEGFDPICFGCPPGIVKDFNRRSVALPSRYVLPIRTFVQGKNNFDFEFIVYTFLFARPSNEKIVVYCTLDQKERLKSILQETLFGPTFQDLIHAQFRRFGRKSGLTDAELKRYGQFLNHIAESKKPFDLYNRLLKHNTPDRQIQSEIREYFQTLIQSKQWLADKSNSKTASLFAKNYIACSQLKKEMDLFSIAKDKSRDEFIDSLIDFELFNKQNEVVIGGSSGKGKVLKIVQVRPSEFDIHQSGERTISVDMLKLDLAPKPEIVTPLEKPFMGVTYLGVGSGFSHKRKNSCLIVWSEGKGNYGRCLQ